MTDDPHHAVESAFFEFSKMKSFLETGVTKRVHNIPLVPIQDAQQYVYSLLLVDLVSVFDMAVEHYFSFLRLKQVRRKSKFTVLEENGHIQNPRYLDWYRSWRNDAAHKFSRIEFHQLRQATKDVGLQLQAWGMTSPMLAFSPYETTTVNSMAKTGAWVEGIVILEFEVWSHAPESGSSRKTIDLSWEDFRNQNANLINHLKTGKMKKQKFEPPELYPLKLNPNHKY
jgi:hypothetical protein